MLLKFIDTKKNIEKIYLGIYPFGYSFFIKLIQVKKNLLSLIRGKFKGYNNDEGIEDFNIQKGSFQHIKRKKGISAFGRLYNSEDFLESTVESHIDYFDEIILVNNNSTDQTENICKKLEKKYPHKIKFYNYPFNVYKIGTPEYKIGKENSIHSLSYYYNWCLSKTTYKYVIKLDDDHICIPEMIQKIILNIHTNGLTSFLQVPLINIFKYEGKFSYSYKSLKSSFAGIFGDFGFFPVTEKSYFIKQAGAETIIFPYRIKCESISFLHLKWLKKSMGLKNYGGEIQKKIKSRINHRSFKDLDQKYIDILHKNGIK